MNDSRKDFRIEFKKNKKILIIFSLLLCVVAIGIGYAILSETLYIKNTVSYEKMNWEVGFSAYEENLGTIPSSVEIGENGNTLTVTCGVIKNTDPETCIAKATISNNSTFDIGLSDEPIITYDDTYIHTMTLKWDEHPTFSNTTVHKNGFIRVGESQDVIITIKTKRLKEDNLPSTNIEVPINIQLNFVEWNGGKLPEKNDLAILNSTTSSDKTAFRSSTYQSKIKTITFEEVINIPDNAIESWDISQNQNRKVMAYVVSNPTDSAYYDLFIQGDGQLYACTNMQYYFSEMNYVDKINGLELLDTSMTTNMEGMFFYMGYHSTVFTLDVSNFDTSDVRDMNRMFYYTGSNSSNLILDVSNFDTSNVENMWMMFSSAGFKSAVFSLDVSNFDTSNVTNMGDMFVGAGYSNPNFTLDVSNFDTSNVTNMSYMFVNVGYSNTEFTLDVSSFNTCNVTNMRSMFFRTGYNSSELTIDLSNFDASKVTDMSEMFYYTGYNSSELTIDLSDFNTSNVTNMRRMFSRTGYNSSELTIDLSNFDTSKVTDMSEMFYETGYNSSELTIDLSNFDTSNVTDMSEMFYRTGYYSTVFTLDVSGFDTSNVTDMSYMFYRTGYNSTLLNTSITIRNPNVNYYQMFLGVATKEGSQITVNYTSETAEIIDSIVNTRTSTNVVKGIQVE